MNWVILHVFNVLWFGIDEFGMIWLIINIGMELVCMITLYLVGETWSWCGLGQNSMNLLVRSHGGALLVKT